MKFKMAVISFFMHLYENCNNIIGVESDEEHLIENQISITFFMIEIS